MRQSCRVGRSDRVETGVEQLPDDCRNAILLHDLEGGTNAEIAEMLGTSVDLVKIRLYRARRKLETASAAHCDFSSDEQGVFVCERAAQSLATPRARPPSRSSVYSS